MKVMFGIQGTGNGHISRARILAKELKERGAHVDCLLSGRDPDKYFDMDIFGNYQTRQGLTFVTENGKVSNLATLKQNNIFRFLKNIFTLDLSKYDLIITDFEPVTAWAAKLRNKPVLGVGHQYAFGENTPLTGDTFFTRGLMKYFAPANQSFGLHWYHYQTNVLPPIVDVRLKSNDDKAHVLVYLPFENQARITALLKAFPEVRFKQYSPDLPDETDVNVDLRKTSLGGFKQDLKSAKAVICNSGFELISECLHIGLNVLTKPLNGQMEQESNALALDQLSFATVTQTLDEESIGAWLKEPRQALNKPLPNVAGKIADAIINRNWRNNEEIAIELWQELST